MTKNQVQFRPLVADDLTLMHRWLNEPGVVRWWEGDDVSWDGVVADYHPDNWDTGYEHWLGLVGGEPIGWIQCCPVAEFDDDDAAPWLDSGVAETGAGIDYLIGQSTARGKGLGSAMINAFVEQVVFGLHPSWTEVAADPYTANVGSCRALAKAGFELIATIDDGDPEGTSSLMRRQR